jgi:hypothetical protein
MEYKRALLNQNFFNVAYYTQLIKNWPQLQGTIDDFDDETLHPSCIFDVWNNLDHEDETLAVKTISRDPSMTAFEGEEVESDWSTLGIVTLWTVMMLNV